MRPDPIYASVPHRPIAAVSALFRSLRCVLHAQRLRIAGTSLPTARQFVAGSVLGNVLYIAGGTIIGAPTPITSLIGAGDALVYGYAFTTDVWASGEIVFLPLCRARRAPSQAGRLCLW